MKLKAPNKLTSVESLSDWELLRGFSFCREMIEGTNEEACLEFHEICNFFHSGDKQAALETIQLVKNIYKEEYDKRHCN
jgi:hypothetical protein